MGKGLPTHSVWIPSETPQDYGWWPPQIYGQLSSLCSQLGVLWIPVDHRLVKHLGLQGDARWESDR